ncbi:hypothetical protein ACFVXQ_33805, partial [Kitasatospora sp. NPDC058263]
DRADRSGAAYESRTDRADRADRPDRSGAAYDDDWTKPSPRPADRREEPAPDTGFVGRTDRDTGWDTERSADRSADRSAARGEPPREFPDEPRSTSWWDEPGEPGTERRGGEPA